VISFLESNAKERKLFVLNKFYILNRSRHCVLQSGLMHILESTSKDLKCHKGDIAPTPDFHHVPQTVRLMHCTLVAVGNV
jgi:hypothetical protein